MPPVHVFLVFELNDDMPGSTVKMIRNDGSDFATSLARLGRFVRVAFRAGAADACGDEISCRDMYTFIACAYERRDWHDAEMCGKEVIVDTFVEMDVRYSGCGYAVSVE